MRRRVIIIVVFTITVSIVAIGFLLRRSAKSPIGKFPASFSLAERQEIISVARRDATRQTLAAMKQGEFQLAWKWIVNARKQTVRGIGRQPGDQIWVHFGTDEPPATEGYAVSARYFRTKTNGHWRVVQFF